MKSANPHHYSNEAETLCSTDTDSKLRRQVSFESVFEQVGTRRFHVLLVSFSVILNIIPASIIGTIPYIKGTVAQEYSVDSGQVAWLSSGCIFASIPGALTFGWLADRLGRKSTIWVCVAISLVLVSMQFACRGAEGFWLLVTLQALLGLPWGGLVTLPFPYVTEFCPSSTRGMIGTATQLGWPLGSIYSLLVVNMVGDARWRWCLLAPVPPCAIVLGWLPFLPESPRWLFVARRKEELERVLDSVFASPPIYGTGTVRKAPEVSMSQAASSDNDQECTARTLYELASPGMRQVTFTVCLLYSCTAAQSYAFWVFGPEIVKVASGQEAPLWVFIGSEGVGALATILAGSVVDSVGRKPLLLVGDAIGLIVLVVLAGKPSLTTACAAWLMVGVSQSFLWSAASVYASEVFPTNLRGTGCGLAQLCARIAAGLCPLFIGAFLARSLELTLGVVAVPLICGALLTVLLMEETAGTHIKD